MLLLIVYALLALSPPGLKAEPQSEDALVSVLGTAIQLVGVPYKSGGTNPDGFDCSGFVGYLYNPFFELPRLSRDMAQSGSPVDYGQWRPGDLLFYATGSDPARINHVAIWLGDNRLIHSISDGPETGVVVTTADARYWNKRYKSSRRIWRLDAVPEPVLPQDVEEPASSESLWNDFDGILRGDFAAWKQQDEEAFEAYKREKG